MLETDVYQRDLFPCPSNLSFLLSTLQSSFKMKHLPPGPARRVYWTRTSSKNSQRMLTSRREQTECFYGWRPCDRFFSLKFLLSFQDLIFPFTSLSFRSIHTLLPVTSPVSVTDANLAPSFSIRVRSEFDFRRGWSVLHTSARFFFICSLFSNAIRTLKFIQRQIIG
jgi:hypothetical protein